MDTISLNRLGGIALIVGPILAIAFFLIQPGGALIDSADSSDAMANITSFASNALLANITSIVIPLGLLLMLYGLYAVQDATRNGGGDALSRFGLLAIAVGVLGWIMAQALHPAMSGADLADPRVVDDMVPVYTVDLSVTLMSSVIVSFGFLVFNLALSTRDDFSKVGVLVIAAVSVVALVSFIIAATMPEHRETAATIGRICYFPWVVWSVALGLNLLKRTPR